MKHRLIIVENNFWKFFAAKQLLEIHYRLKVTIVETTGTVDGFFDVLLDLNPSTVLCSEKIGILALCEAIEKRNLNRRNSEVFLIIQNEIPGLDFCLSSASTQRIAGGSDRRDQMTSLAA